MSMIAVVLLSVAGPVMWILNWHVTNPANGQRGGIEFGVSG